MSARQLPEDSTHSAYAQSNDTILKQAMEFCSLLRNCGFPAFRPSHSWVESRLCYELSTDRGFVLSHYLKLRNENNDEPVERVGERTGNQPTYPAKIPQNDCQSQWRNPASRERNQSCRSSDVEIPKGGEEVKQCVEVFITVGADILARPNKCKVFVPANKEINRFCTNVTKILCAKCGWNLKSA